MTKCHFLALLLSFTLVAAVLSGCRSNGDGRSLSEYGRDSQATRMAMFEQYALELDTMDPVAAAAAQEARLDITDSAAFQQELALQEKYFYDPNSPFRSEEYLIPVYRKVLTSPFSTVGQKESAAYYLPLFSLNRIGEPAADFTFTLKGGRTRTLRSVKADNILLFFSNPGCDNCKEITERVSGDPLLQELVSSGKLAVVNIYPDEDIDAWYGYVENYPAEWVSGYAPDIDEPSPDGTQLYNIRAIPSLYLLDGDCKVLMKDAPLEKVISGIFRR